MKLLAACILGAACLSAAANNDEAIQRALIQRDQQSAEFAARVRGQDVSRLEQLHARQLQDPALSNPVLSPFQRQRMADERSLLALPPPIVRGKSAAPLPLPGGPRHGVDPIPAQGLGH